MMFFIAGTPGTARGIPAPTGRRTRAEYLWHCTRWRGNNTDCWRSNCDLFL